MNRRGLLLGSMGAIVTSIPCKTSAQESDEALEIQIDGDLPPLPDDLSKYADLPPAPYTELAQVGTGRPSDDEIKSAYEILAASPFNTSHLEVTNYFLNISGSQAIYRREWPERANPMIYHFFAATETKPEGDVTAWCAAFANWVLLRSQAKAKDEIGKAPGSFSVSGVPFSGENIKKFSTHSASSGSFRCWKETKSPKAGDILVLANKGTESLTKYCRGQGHVTFFLRRIDENWVEVVGGNQSQPGSNGAITKAKVFIGKGSRFLKFVIV